MYVKSDAACNASKAPPLQPRHDEFKQSSHLQIPGDKHQYDAHAYSDFMQVSESPVPLVAGPSLDRHLFGASCSLCHRCHLLADKTGIHACQSWLYCTRSQQYHPKMSRPPVVVEAMAALDKPAWFYLLGPRSGPQF